MTSFSRNSDGVAARCIPGLEHPINRREQRLQEENEQDPLQMLGTYFFNFDSF